MTLRDFLLAWHLATHQNPRLAVSLQQAILEKADLSTYQNDLTNFKCSTRDPVSDVC